MEMEMEKCIRVLMCETENSDSGSVRQASTFFL